MFDPIRVKAYTIPGHYTDKVEAEIKEIETLKVIQRSRSNYASLKVIIRKKMRDHQNLINYRRLNYITVTDAESIPSSDELITLIPSASKLITLISSSSIISKFNMTKGYYQIPMTPKYKYLTAFFYCS